ncbi:hypothetical protein [Corynebacterium tapiri]|uniref:Uncharacterized protein n=1 Tax=Corynebacterium tapiri TaxID=1448266 RepID=A0A5C4U2F1_9CORY|nr:hypothetical protein [Corynebacterium tapiri]TNL95331.1 hypothetical protein FHE74_09610 [Corynebacterium tapiri]
MSTVYLRILQAQASYGWNWFAAIALTMNFGFAAGSLNAWLVAVLAGAATAVLAGAFLNIREVGRAYGLATFQLRNFKLLVIGVIAVVYAAWAGIARGVGLAALVAAVCVVVGCIFALVSAGGRSDWTTTTRTFGHAPGLSLVLIPVVASGLGVAAVSIGVCLAGTLLFPDLAEALYTASFCVLMIGTATGPIVHGGLGGWQALGLPRKHWLAWLAVASIPTIAVGALCTYLAFGVVLEAANPLALFPVLVFASWLCSMAVARWPRFGIAFIGGASPILGGLVGGGIPTVASLVVAGVLGVLCVWIGTWIVRGRARVRLAQ